MTEQSKNNSGAELGCWLIVAAFVWLFFILPKTMYDSYAHPPKDYGVDWESKSSTEIRAPFGSWFYPDRIKIGERGAVEISKRSIFGHSAKSIPRIQIKNITLNHGFLWETVRIDCGDFCSHTFWYKKDDGQAKYAKDLLLGLRPTF